MSAAAQSFCAAVTAFISQQGSSKNVSLGKIGGCKEVQRLWKTLKAGQPNTKLKMNQVLTQGKVTGWTKKGEKTQNKERKRKRSVEESVADCLKRIRVESNAADTKKPAHTMKNYDKLLLFPGLAHLEEIWTRLCQHDLDSLRQEMQNLEQQRKSIEQQRLALTTEKDDVEQQRNMLKQERAEFEEQKKRVKKELDAMAIGKVSTRWMFEDGHDWKPYSPEHSAGLTVACESGMPSVSLQRSAFTYDIDLRLMQQVNRQTGTRRRVQSQVVFMDDMLRCPIHVCQKLEARASNCRLALCPGSLVKGSLEESLYCRAEAQYHRMSTQTTRLAVSKVEVIVNKDLAQKYEEAKAKLAAAGQLVVEEYGFHGTLAENISRIAEEGFKVGGAGVPIRNGAANGHGVYLAKHPELSLGFTNGARNLLVVKFLSSQANAHREAWVVPQPEHIYPEFILHCN